MSDAQKISFQEAQEIFQKKPENWSDEKGPLATFFTTTCRKVPESVTDRADALILLWEVSSHHELPFFQNLLGDYFQKGIGWPSDPAQAHYWHEQAEKSVGQQLVAAQRNTERASPRRVGGLSL